MENRPFISNIKQKLQDGNYKALSENESTCRDFLNGLDIIMVALMRRNVAKC